MSQESGLSSGPASIASPSWIRVWLSALTRPTVETFQNLVSDPKATSQRAYRWVFASTFLGYILLSIIVALIGMEVASTFGFAGIAGTVAGTSLLIGVVYGLIGGAVAVLATALLAGISHLVARALGGAGTYAKLVYAFAAFLAPLTLVSLVIAPLPYVTYLQYALMVYEIVLLVIAVKAVNQVTWGRAIVSALTLPAAVLVVAVVVIFILASIGTAVGNIYSDITGIITASAPSKRFTNAQATLAPKQIATATSARPTAKPTSKPENTPLASAGQIFEGDGFTLASPDGWASVDVELAPMCQEAECVLAISSPDDEIMLALQRFEMAGNVTAEQLDTMIWAMVEGSDPSLKLESREEIALDRQPAIMRVASVADPSSPTGPAYLLLLVTAKDNIAYQLTGISMSAEAFEQALPGVEAILDSWRFVP